MRDDHLTHREVWSEVKGFPKHVCEGLQVNYLNVDMIRIGGKRRTKRPNYLFVLVHRGQTPDSYLTLFFSCRH